MRRIWIVAAAAVLAVVAAYIAYAAGQQTATYSAGHGPGHNAVSCPPGAAARPHGWLANASAYPPTAENLTVAMSSGQVSLDLRLVGIVRGPYGVARVVAGSGVVEAGGRTYAVESAFGVVGRGAFALRLYTGDALIYVAYRGGVYRAVVQPLGVAQMTVYYGNATAQIT
jgi:hypothetical protein